MEKWRDKGGAGVDFLELSRDGLVWYIEETPIMDEEEAIVGRRRRKGWWSW